MSSIRDWGVGGVVCVTWTVRTIAISHHCLCRGLCQPVLASDDDVGHQPLFMWATGQNYTPVLQPPPEQGSRGLAHLQQTDSAHSQELLHLTFMAAQTLSKCIKTWSDSDYSLSLTFNSWDTASKNESSEERFISSFCFNSLLLLQLTLTISTHRGKSEVTYQSRFSVFFPQQI